MRDEECVCVVSWGSPMSGSRPLFVRLGGDCVHQSPQRPTQSAQTLCSSKLLTAAPPVRVGSGDGDGGGGRGGVGGGGRVGDGAEIWGLNF